MECVEVRKFVYVYLDGEFEERERVAFEHHLAGCDGCRQEVAFEEGFRDLLRARLERPAAPATLRARIVKDLDEEDARTPRSFWDRLTAWPLAVRLIPVGAVAALALVLAWPAAVPVAPSEPDSAIANVVEETIDVHRRAVPAEVQGDARTISSFVAKNASFTANPPLAESAQTKLIGARLTQVRGRPAVLYVYDHKGKRVSVVQFTEPVRPHSAPFRRSYYTGQTEGFNVVLFRDEERGIANTVVGDVDDHELLRLIPASYQR